MLPSESQSSPLAEDLYKYIHPPLPLFPKHKYTDDAPQSPNPLLYPKFSSLSNPLTIQDSKQLLQPLPSSFLPKKIPGVTPISQYCLEK